MPTALAAVMSGPHKPVEVCELPLPELEDNSALFKVEFSEICGTDVHLHEGRLAGVPYPIIPGHVSVGILEKIRGELLDVDGNAFQEGDRVTFLDVHKTCNHCRACLIDKASTRCPSRKVYGITYGLDDGLTGGWSQYIYVKPGTICISMNDVPSELYMAGGCSLPTSLHATDRADIRIGETVLVLGAGPVGLSSIGFARMRGAEKVICIGGPDSRLEVARKMGVAATLNFAGRSESEMIDWVHSHTNDRGADVSIEATGAPVAAVQAMRYTRDAGRVVIVGQYTNLGNTEINPHLDINQKHLDIRGCWGSDYSHFHRVVEVLKTDAGKEIWSHMKLEKCKLSEMNEALADVKSGRSIKSLVVPEL